MNNTGAAALSNDTTFPSAAREAFSQSAALRRLFRLRRTHPILADELDALAAELGEFIDAYVRRSR